MRFSENHRAERDELLHPSVDLLPIPPDQLPPEQLPPQRILKSAKVPEQQLLCPSTKISGRL